jgi:hypothetical protein
MLYSRPDVKFFSSPICLYHLRNTISFLFNGYLAILLPGLKRPEREVDKLALRTAKG